MAAERMMIIPIFLSSIIIYTISCGASAVSLSLSSFVTGPQGLRVVGFSLSQTGYSVANAGDFNNDNISDFIFGSPSANANSLIGNGVAFIILGNFIASTATDEVDISTFVSGSAGMKVIGAANSNSVGRAVGAAGDVNDDGFDDVLIAAPFSESNAGTVYVIFGRAGPYSDLLVANLVAGTQGFSIIGSTVDTYLGFEPASLRGNLGDINGDGIDDFMIGSAASSSGKGATFVLYGKASTTTVADINLATLGADQGVQIVGASSGDCAGYSVAAPGDVNGDGINDILIGAHQYDPPSRNDAGGAYLIYGSHTLTSSIDLAFFTTGSHGVRFLGAAANDNLGQAVSGAGDINGDGLKDILLGAWHHNSESRSDAGRLYVIFGSTTVLSADIDLQSFTAGATGYHISGAAANDLLGISAAPAGDINQDGLADFIVGAPGGTTGTGGFTYVLFGSTAMPSSNVDLLTSTAAYRVVGPSYHSRLGFSVDGGADWTGDGIPDILLGGYQATLTSAIGQSVRSSAGAVYVLAGPLFIPTAAPTTMPTAPSTAPTYAPTAHPSTQPSGRPSSQPSVSAATLEAFLSSPTYRVRNGFAFAALDVSGRVHTWGEAGFGGDSFAVSALLLANVTDITPSRFAFTARKSDGRLTSWGVAGGAATDVTPDTSAVMSASVAATESSFAGIASAGQKVVVFGSKHHGGDLTAGSAHCSGCLTALQALFSGVVTIIASAGAFAAIKSDGSVYSWGNPLYGAGESTASMPGLMGVRVRSVTATMGAFAVLLESSGRVITWGDAWLGGDSSSVASQLLADVVHVIASRAVFAAFKKDSSLVVWGHPLYGGDVSAVASQLVDNVAFVAHTFTAMAALKRDGTVVTWGKADGGGDSSAVQDQLVEIVKIYGNSKAFAAVTAAGGVVTWGRAGEGGTIPTSKVSALSSGVLLIYHTNKAFAAIKEGGVVVVWGQAGHGGSPGAAVEAHLVSGVHTICSNDAAFSAIKTDGSVVAWGHPTSVPVDGMLFSSSGLTTAPTCA